MPILQISETHTKIQSAAAPTSHFTIHNTESSQRIEQIISFPSVEADAEEIRWYLEDYVVRDCFEESRAKKAATALNNLGRHLIGTIRWDRVIDPSELCDPLTIHVWQSNVDGRSHIFWELLEQSELWPESTRPSTVTVSRTIVTDPLDSVAEWNLGTPSNILVCTARPNKEGDIPHRLVTSNIVSASPSYAHIDVVRPGTFSAFKEQLLAHCVGYYDLVHFDLHGVEHASGK